MGWASFRPGMRVSTQDAPGIKRSAVRSPFSRIGGTGRWGVSGAGIWGRWISRVAFIQTAASWYSVGLYSAFGSARSDVRLKASRPGRARYVGSAPGNSSAKLGEKVVDRGNSRRRRLGAGGTGELGHLENRTRRNAWVRKRTPMTRLQRNGLQMGIERGRRDEGEACHPKELGSVETGDGRGPFTGWGDGYGAPGSEFRQHVPPRPVRGIGPAEPGCRRRSGGSGERWACRPES